MRIAIGEVSHETNTFCPALTEVTEFRAREWAHGQEIVARHRSVRSYLGGMLDAAESLGIEIAPTFATRATPSGTISHHAYEMIRNELLIGLRNAGPIEAICLALHGAGVAEHVDDLEGDLLARVREQVGSTLPIIVTLDLHANVTPEMARHATALLAVNFYPHVDSYDRGSEAIRLAHRIVGTGTVPRTHLSRIPMLVPTSATSLSPVKEINERCWGWEAKPGVIDCTFVHGFPHTDVPLIAASVIAIADGDGAIAREAATDVASFAWQVREGLLRRSPAPAEAVRQALSLEGGPIVINETSDNPGGGAPGDGTHLLRALLDANTPSTCFGFIYDRETAVQAHAAGVGATIRVLLGGKTDHLHGAPIETDAYVTCLTDGRFIRQSPMGRGAQADLGRMARLRIGAVDVLVSSVREQTLDAEVFLLHGIDVTRYKIVGLKSSQHFRAGFEPLAAHILTADSPGLTTLDLTSFPYRRVNRPVWPLDLEMTYRPA